MKKRKKLMIWINTLPAMILIGAIIVFPILYTAYISFTNMNLFHWNDYKFVGSHTQRCEEVGNAVPPALSTAIAKSVKGLLDSYYNK